MLKETFDTVSSGYDGGALRFFPQSAQSMASLLDLRGDEDVLDVACGTGHASLAVARMLPNGRVTGVDFSAGMRFVCRCAQHGRLAPMIWDAAVCQRLRPGMSYRRNGIALIRPRRRPA